jgi:hypothetical protein
VNEKQGKLQQHLRQTGQAEKGIEYDRFRMKLPMLSMLDKELISDDERNFSCCSKYVVDATVL